jgi:hypothetical protein
VTSSSSTLWLSSSSAAPWMAAPSATTSSGCTPLRAPGRRTRGPSAAHLGMRVMPPTSITSSMGSPMPASSTVFLQILIAALDRSTPVFELSRGSGSSAGAGRRCRPVEMMKGRLISVSRALDSSHLAFSAASLRRWQRHLVLAQVDLLCSRAKSRHQPVDDAAVEVLAAEERVARGRQHLEDAVGDLEDRDVERAAAEVVHRDAACRWLFAVAVGQRGGGGLVDDADDVEAGDRPASLVAWRWASLKYAGTVITALVDLLAQCTPRR